MGRVSGCKGICARHTLTYTCKILSQQVATHLKPLRDLSVWITNNRYSYRTVATDITITTKTTYRYKSSTSLITKISEITCDFVRKHKEWYTLPLSTANEKSIVTSLAQAISKLKGECSGIRIDLQEYSVIMFPANKII